MSSDHLGPALEHIEGLGQLGVALVGCDEERVVRGQFAGGFPYAFHRHELGRVGRQAMELDAVTVLAQPTFAVVLEPVVRRVVDDQEHLAAVVAAYQLPQELEERGPVEHVREAERELGGVERNRTEDVCGLAQSVGVDARLNPNTRPGAMQAAVLPKAGLILEDHDTATASGLLSDRGQALGEPDLLGRFVGACKPLAGPLHREAKLMQQPRDVVVVVSNAEPAADQIADPRSGPEATRVARRLRPLLDQPGELLVLRRGEPGRRARRLAGPQRLGPRGIVPPKPLVHRRPRHLEFGRDGQDLLAVDVVPHRLASPPCSQIALLPRFHDQRTKLGQLVPRRPLRLDRLARLSRRLLDPDQSHDRLLETDRRNLRRTGSRHNLIDAGGSNLPRRAGHQPMGSCLDHPYATHIYSYGAEDEGRLLWIAMERVRGVPLDVWLDRQGPMSPESFGRFFEGLCEVIHVAHKQGIIHRDLKPSNIMVIECEGRLLPKLLDFGIAKWHRHREVAPDPGSDEDRDPDHNDVKTVRMPVRPRRAWRTVTCHDSESRRQLTPPGGYVGSPPYMALELWVGADAAGPEADIYALAIIAYETLTGRRLFVANRTSEYLDHHKRACPPPL